MREYVEKFWTKVDRSGGPGACWIWTGGKTIGGYGRYRGKKAHRVAWEIENGPIPERLHVCHDCDNPPCCNPAHLVTGTPLDSARDRSTKGRTRAFQPFPVELTAQLLDMVDRGMPLSEIGRRFGITPKRVAGIATRNGRTPPEPHTEHSRPGRPYIK